MYHPPTVVSYHPATIVAVAVTFDRKFSLYYNQVDQLPRTTPHARATMIIIEVHKTGEPAKNADTPFFFERGYTKTK